MSLPPSKFSTMISGWTRALDDGLSAHLAGNHLDFLAFQPVHNRTSPSIVAAPLASINPPVYSAAMAWPSTPAIRSRKPPIR